jgi:prephenate dehydrogenase
MSQKIVFNKILIYGLGVIGGSIAKKLNQLNTQKELKIYGITRREETAKKAIELGIVNDSDIDFKTFADEVDFLIFSLPPLKVLETLKEIFPYLKKDVLITDVSSVKGEVYFEIEKFIAENNLKHDKQVVYIGSHPMAGSEKKGLENSAPDMLDDSMVLITPFCNFPGGKRHAFSLQKIENFWQILGCKTKIISVEKHDIFTAYTSHFNHLLANVISNVVAKQAEIDSDVKFAIGTSFCDMTRIADSDSELWTEIVSMNKKNILNVLKNYKDNIFELEKILKESQNEKILNFFIDGKKNKNLLLKKNKLNM